MDGSEAPPPAPDPFAALARARELYEGGLYLQAFRAAEIAGPLARWRGLDGRILAGQLAWQLGAPRLAQLLMLRARRAHPESERAWAWAVRVLRSRLGPFAALAMLRRGGPTREPDAEVLALWGSTAAQLKDFAEAERQLDLAEAAAPADPWIHMERCQVLEAADDYAGALRAAQRALEIRPWYRPGVEGLAEQLVLLGRESEAMAFLEEAVGRLESGSLASTLLGLQIENGRLADAEATLERIEALSPLRSADWAAWFEGRRSDVAWLLGDRARAVRHARRARRPFYDRLADRLERGHDGRRVLLPVGFVRQHDKTCGPATLTTLARFHGVEAVHLEIAEAICYDGTPDHAERRWAAEQGFLVREFTVTWEAARALLDRELPFTLTTVHPGSAHLQAVVGYDDERYTLLLRDPYLRTLGEMAAPGLRDHRASGPRGMAMVPRARAERLQGLELPEAEWYDLYHDVQAALVAHQRPRAEAGYRDLAERAPGHRLTLQARRSMAGYDGDEEACLAATEALLALFPDDVNLRLSKQASLASLGRRAAQLDFLHAECARLGHPLLFRALAEALRCDARTLPQTTALARRVVRSLPLAADGYHLLGHICWERQERDEALRAYRAASCLEWADERYAESYFRAARALGGADEAIAFLRERVERRGRLSSQPAMTLFEALDALERTAEAFQVLGRALSLRPADGPLLLFAARAHAAAGRTRESEALLAQARGAAREPEVLRAEARLAESAGELARAADLWNGVADLEPLDVGAVRAATRLTADTRGRAEALKTLRRRVERAPHHQELAHLLVGWLEDESLEAAEAELRRLLGLHPADAWAWRELAALASRGGRTDEALAALEHASEIDPAAPALHNVRGAVLAAAGRIQEAKAALRRSLELSVDEDWALSRLLELSADATERREQLRFVYAQLLRQVIFGDGLLAYQRFAERLLPPEEILEALRAGHRARPDLWHAWVALAGQLRHQGALDEARGLLEEAARRFSALPRVFVEMAALARAAGDTAMRRRALEQAVSLSPGWSEAAADLASLLQDLGEYQAELDVLQRALRHAPGEVVLHAWHGDALRLLGRRDEALSALERVLRLDPGHAWAWDTLVHLAREARAPRRPAELAEALVRERPRDSNAWVLLARSREEPAARLEALDRAIDAWPRNAAAWEMRVDALAEAGRLEEAHRAAAPAAFAGAPPRSLRLRAARLRAAHGEAAEARRSLRALTEAEPDYVEAWQQLADWEAEDGRPAESLAAAREVVRLAPHRGVSHGYLGQAQLLAGEREPGKASLRRAVELDPSYGWALRRLFSLELDDGQLDAAAHTLALLERHFGAAEAAAGRVRIAAAGGDRAATVARLGALLEQDDFAQIKAALEACDLAGWREAADAAVEEQLLAGRASRPAGELWAVRAAPGGRWRRQTRWLARLLAAGPAPAALGAAAEWAGQLARAGQGLRLLGLLRRRGAMLAADAGTWGMLGYALSVRRFHRRACRWLAGWRGRDGLEPWMLDNLAVSLRALGRLQQAGEVSRAALDLPRDHTTVLHRIFLAADAALVGDFGPLDAVGSTPSDLSGYYRFLLGLAGALRDGLSASDRRAGWRAARQRLAAVAAARVPTSGEPFLRHFRRRAVWALARRRGGLLAPVWFVAGMAVAGALTER